ncbi:signal peptidase II [Pseudothermotoga thermarum]|uniref:Lipoprotein signal peptidase n=1 Tax=Pseudothermotoga thermarum DSM 5069 TaxID=688269 RepID=F7YXP3_9THEM|nr:signal peptidase II [Pseudothermotoga thermarum]AEH50687.1 lipoprotein signal peptidase [Pseudothermotoga thermarum DSM 5069]
MFWVILVLLIDQLSKALVERFLIGPVFVIPGFLWLTYTRNTGIAFGMFSKSSWIIWVILSVTICLALIPYFVKVKTLTKVGLEMIVAGSIANNFVDRIRLGYVVDFINLRFFPAVFNFADVFITIGGFLVVLSLLRGEKDGI